MRMTLAATLRRLTQRMPVMLLVATHDESVIREADAVYDVEEGVWHQMGSYYIDALRKRTEEHIEKVYGLRK
jgi:ABC-type lipoprotein export system ATPase subunit